jgi:hypothetical protein
MTGFVIGAGADAALYYRLDHSLSYTRQHWDKVRNSLKKRILKKSPFFRRAARSHRGVKHGCEKRCPRRAVHMIAEFLERLRYEGNTHLLDAQVFGSIQQNFASRFGKFGQTSHLHRGLFQIRQRYELAKLIYPESPGRRFAYRFRHLIEMAEKLFG